jgi:hypothetical protein
VQCLLTYCELLFLSHLPTVSTVIPDEVVHLLGKTIRDGSLDWWIIFEDGDGDQSFDVQLQLM